MKRSLVIVILVLSTPLAVVPIFLRPRDEPQRFVVIPFSRLFERPGVVERTLATVASKIGWEPNWVQDIQVRELMFQNLTNPWGAESGIIDFKHSTKGASP